MPPLFPHRFIRVRVAYEDLIFSVLSLVLILLAGFCLGVERGKRLVVPDVPAEERLAVQRQVVLPVQIRAVAEVPVKETVSSSTEVPVRVPAVSVSGPEGPYAIQLASYVTPLAAQAEADRLRRLGFTARVIKQGKYFELRVVGYRSKSEASGSLAMLRKTYHDSFIKRLSSG